MVAARLALTYFAEWQSAQECILESNRKYQAIGTSPVWQIMFLAIAPAIGIGICRFAYALVLPDMRDSLGWSYSVAGVMNTQRRRLSGGCARRECRYPTIWYAPDNSRQHHCFRAHACNVRAYGRPDPVRLRSVIVRRDWSIRHGGGKCHCDRHRTGATPASGLLSEPVLPWPGHWNSDFGIRCTVPFGVARGRILVDYLGSAGRDFDLADSSITDGACR